jgi:hypothetical protein
MPSFTARLVRPESPSSRPDLELEKTTYVSAICMGGNFTMRVFARSAFAVAVLAVATARPSGADELKTGDMIDKNSWEKAEKLLPPEILRHYKEGEYSNKFVDWPASKFDFPPDFKAGSEANEGKFTTNPEGTILDKATGKQPPYIMGHPFPTIDPNDPAAAVKIL